MTFDIGQIKQKVTAYSHAGWWVFPCRPGRKEPVGGRGFHDAVCDAQVVHQWWSEQPDANVGLHLGKSGLFALDIEVTEHDWLSKVSINDTFVQATANGGWHFVYQQPHDFVVPSVPLGQLDGSAEIKGDGGYILLSPSALYGSVARCGLPSGYRIISDVAPSQAPGWLLDAIRAHMARGATERMRSRASNSVMASSGLQNLTAQDRVDDILATVSSAAVGTRSNVLISAAASLGRVVGGGYLSHSQAVGLLESVTICAGWDSPKKTLDTIERGLQAGEIADPWFPDEVSGLSDEHIHDLLSSLDDGLEGVPQVEEQPQAVGQDGIAADAEGEPAVVPSLALVHPVVPSQALASIPEDAASRDALREELVERVAQLSGVTADFVELARQCSIYWQPGFAIGGAIALGSVLGARRLIWPGRSALTTSCYVLVAGGSGDGKSTAKAPVDMCLEEWPDLIGGNSLASFQANFESIRNAAESGHGQLWVLDEYYRVIESMTSQKAASFNAENRGLLLEMATINTGTYRRKKSKFDSKDGHQFEVVHVPGFSMLALSATERLFEVLGKGSVADGYLPRHLLFLPQSRLPRKSRGRPPMMNHRLRSAMNAARTEHAAWVDGLGLSAWQGVPVDASDEARVILEAFGDALDSERRQARGKGDVSAPEAVLARGEEQAIRTAMCLGALAQAGAKTVRVDAELAYLACDIVALSLADVAIALREHTSESQYEGHLAAMRRTIARLAGPDGWVPWSRILGSMRVGDTAYLGRLVGHLVAAEEAEVAEYQSPKGGPKGKKIRLTERE